ncbi:Na+/H+ antiporter subunit E [Actinospica sp. MGRD01-02]|uniref:Na+/H+ antiporter subunit E n=1 Tax=Actinospica acidithermotolerans TaxID=2828514 RepID=A0A941IMU9_9ACTN|nr:Na+/H+ antiporter subunit E [Actinospica acidithermotolerans]MBR7828896.1 Na+/H+ antiporter subunit E [Actinospica acidithermotolerans]
MKALRSVNARATSPLAVVWLLGVWLLLWGSISPLAIVSGLLIGFGLLWATPQPAVEIGLRFRPLAAISLLLFVTVDLVVSSCRVAWHILTPTLPESAIYNVPLRVRGGLMITMVAVAVTAVPGSTVIDARPEDGMLEIHVFDASSSEAEQNIRRDVQLLERRITAAFGSRAERRRVLEAEE